MVETRSSRRRNTLQTHINNAQLNRSSPQQPPLSTLPDAILVDILSRISTKLAVSTSVLSTRWRYLWTQLTNICLDCRHIPKQKADFYPLVDQLLTCNTSPHLHTFSINVSYPRQQHFELWLTNLATRNIQNIGITVESPSQGDYARTGSTFTLPTSLFGTQSLVSLILPHNCVNYDYPSNTRVISKLPNLIKLELSLCASQCGFVAKLVRSCPLLEDLSLTPSKL